MKAIYRQNTLHTGNPFIEAMPGFLSEEELTAAIRHVPVTGAGIRDLPTTERLELVLRITEAFIPLEYTYAIYNILYSGILGSFIGKGSTEEVRQATRIKELFEMKATAINSFATQAVSASILGVSGIGKTSTITRILNCVPQVIEHTEYNGNPFLCKQINYVAIQCPSDCSVKSTCLYILGEIDKIIYTDYAAKAQKRQSITMDAMVAQISQLCITHHIGVVVIDEIQNVVSSNPSGGRNMQLVRFLIELMNSTGISVVFVGTPDVGELFDSHPHLARRTRGLRLIQPEYEDGFIRLLKAMWGIQYTQNTEPLTDGIAQLLFGLSGGVPALLSQILYYAQRHAIMSGRERMNEKIIKEAAKLYQLKPNMRQYEGASPSAFEKVILSEKFISKVADVRPARGRVAQERDKNDLLALSENVSSPAKLWRVLCESGLAADWR